ncbi:MAG: amidohydrolase [Verrucomicrobia bacterium]|nr:amidohydrolase [Verrucomicrobiota bacterium]MBU1734918.1 amidohydrolase [Verrucomicrobiota bacterium]MBU1857712.1 amidohydrolase [Verrucomicrobiota bacterium]
MKPTFFDANLCFGRPIRTVYQPAKTAADLQRVMAHAGIAKGLVWHVAQRDYAASDGNRLLAKALAGRKNMYGCWVILPPQTDEIITPDFFRRMQRNRIMALRAFPDYHRYLLNRVVFGKFLDEVTERRIPLLLSLEKSSVTWPVVYQILAEFPNLTCILCDIGIWNSDRFTWPLLETYPNVFLETSLLSLEDGGIEETVARYGAERLLFGSNFPERYPEGAMLAIQHAAIPTADKKKIASANLEGLIQGAQL